MRVRLLADDLTGALDTSAELAALAGPVKVSWTARHPVGGSAALDLGTREGTRAAAVSAASSAAPFLRDADLAFLKVDSLLRGHGMAELGAILSQGCFERCIVAPAFPHQGRLTRGGRQFRRAPDGTFEEVADVVGLLAAAGVAARPGTIITPLAGGVTVFDAETDADLDRVAALAQTLPGPILWCGSAGLASALARAEVPLAAPALDGPVLGLFGSDQAVTAAQLSACGRRWMTLPDGSAGSAARVARALDRDGVALASLALPGGLARTEAAARIAEDLGALALRLPRPGTLLVAGGETLRGLCESFGTESLAVIGQIEPGLPISSLRGGRWDGLRVVSKSGAFGGPTLWRDLVAPFLLTADATP